MVGTRCRQPTAEMGCCLLRIQIVLYFIPLISEGDSLLPHSTEKGCVEDGCCVVLRVRNGVHGGRWCRWRVSDGVDGVRFSTRCSSDSEVGQLCRTSGSNDLSPHIPPFSLPLTLRTHRSKHLDCSIPRIPVSDRLPHVPIYSHSRPQLGFLNEALGVP